MADKVTGKKKTGKRQKPVFYGRQYGRTAKNKAKARLRHGLQHPNDKQAPQDWGKHPIRYQK